MNKERFRGVIFGKYKTIKEFSDAIGWNRNKTSRFLNGVQEPDSEEMRKFAEFFQLSPDEFIEIFFANEAAFREAVEVAAGCIKKQLHFQRVINDAVFECFMLAHEE